MWWILLVVTIIQWNARSLLANGQEFKKLISDKIDKPHIICIQESWLKPHLSFVNGYMAVRKDRSNDNGGGVMTFLKSEITYNTVEI